MTGDAWLHEIDKQRIRAETSRTALTAVPCEDTPQSLLTEWSQCSPYYSDISPELGATMRCDYCYTPWPTIEDAERSVDEPDAADVLTHHLPGCIWLRTWRLVHATAT